MPIDIDRFEDPDALGDPPTSQRIVRFLRERDDQAFTRGEITEAIDADPGTVGTNLTRLKDRGLVRHRAPYWAIADDRPRVDDADGGGENAGPPDHGGHEGGPREAVANDGERRSEAERSGGDSGTSAPRAHREAARAFFERVRESLDDSVVGLYLFGSVARGDQSSTSDVDVLAVVADGADYAAVDDRLLEIAFDVQLDHGVSVEVHSIRATEFADRKDRGEPFVTNVLAEGKPGG